MKRAKGDLDKVAATEAAWGLAVDAWLESMLKDLTTKAARSRKVPTKVLRLAEVRSGYTDPASKRFVPAIQKALKHLEFP